MEFERILELVGNEPVFESALLLAGKVDPGLVRLAHADQERIGVWFAGYTPSPHLTKVKPHPF
jgi:hypothetical protein